MNFRSFSSGQSIIKETINIIFKCFPFTINHTAEEENGCRSLEKDFIVRNNCFRHCNATFMCRMSFPWWFAYNIEVPSGPALSIE